MAKKERRATEILNVELAGIESALSVALSLIGSDGPAPGILQGAIDRCEEARQALITIQFHAAQI